MSDPIGLIAVAVFAGTLLLFLGFWLLVELVGKRKALEAAVIGEREACIQIADHVAKTIDPRTPAMRVAFEIGFRISQRSGHGNDPTAAGAFAKDQARPNVRTPATGGTR